MWCWGRRSPSILQSTPLNGVAVATADRWGPDYSIASERADIAAIQSATGARCIFGHSYGGLIALNSAEGNKNFARVAVYEPGVSVGGCISSAWMKPYEDAVDAGDRTTALATFVVGSGPRNARRVPVWAMKILMRIFIPAAERATMLKLLVPNLREHRVIVGLNDTYPEYARISSPVLLMYGGKSDLDWMPETLHALNITIPNSETVEFPLLDHLAPQSRHAGEIVAKLVAFFEVASDAGR